MIKSIKNRVWAFDLEWVPDPLAGRLLHAVVDDTTDAREVLETMWREGGATEEDPTPYLKTVLCRVVSIAAVERRVRSDGEISVKLTSLPHDPDEPSAASEASVVGRFLDAVGEYKPQLVGFNSIASDLTILVQRGMILGLRAEGFCARPDKPWEGIDYFSRGSEWNIDLKDVLGSWGKASPSLHELAVQAGIPGKMDVDGEQVAQLWLAGELRRIVQYNEHDALTTYLVWLRTAHFAGHFSDAEYAHEQELVETMVRQEAELGPRTHLRSYLDEWARLREIIAGRA